MRSKKIAGRIHGLSKEFTIMSGIISTKFVQIENHPLQELSDIRAIGLLAHLMSMPPDWVICKTQLYKKFGRAMVTNAIAVLEENRHWVHIDFRDGSKNLHAYRLSDIAFTDDQVTELLNELREAGFQVKNVSPSFQHLLATRIEHSHD
ncbi:hypothetical protein [Bacillus sp. B15-48]|uniref:hypothetical protein n=1 Tax=Bacillus sp. B15-48 TaxID=1548601 RepID=UPI00193FF2F8|nr:hypothetical protein [Bacillus sp. B15-48]MBM4761442.1 hypothetical protein [Bacillus sp. B15-48]